MTNVAERINSDKTIPRKIFTHCTERTVLLRT